MKIGKSFFFVLSVFWIIAFLLYRNTAGAGFVTDEIGWLQNYKATGCQGIFNAFGDRSLHFIYHLIGYFLWKLLALNGMLWMLVFVSLHALVATLSYSIFKLLFAIEEIAFSTSIAFIGALLFLISPYQTEPLVWYACIHYLVCSLLILLSFRFLLSYLQNRQPVFVAIYFVCFILSLFTLEISFALPIILFFFFTFWPSKIFRGTDRIELVKVFVLPSVLLLGAYFLLSKILRGSAVGHYGAAEHLNFSIPLLMANLSKYVSKIFLLTQFWSFEKRNWLYLFFEKQFFGYSLFAAMVLIAFAYMFFQHKLKSKVKILLLLFAFFIIALLPILNLFFSSIVNIEGDRFTYFASIFAAQFIGFTAIFIFRQFGWILLIAYAFFSFKFLAINTDSWTNSLSIQTSLVEKFRWSKASKIYLLNIPDNFNGAYMFRSFEPDNSFAETLALRRGLNMEDRTIEILEYNMTALTDSVSVEKSSNTDLKVTFMQWGNWWWRQGKGIGNYSTPEFDVMIDEWSHSYTLHFKSKTRDAVYLYQCGGEWREVKGF